MNRLGTFCRKLQLRQIITVFFASLLLVFSTACSGAIDAQGANPNNPPVQAGGANNPYKGGGDANTNLKISTDPKVNDAKAKSQRDRASLELLTQRMIAANRDSGKLYSGSETPAGRAQKLEEMPIKTQQDFRESESGGINQRNPDLGERIENRLDVVKDTFKEATDFVKGKADEAGQRPEAKSNPALHE